MKSLESRLDRLEANSQSKDIIMIFIKEGQTLKDAVDEFNKMHKAKLKLKDVERWDCFPKFESVKISPTWNFADFLKHTKAKILGEPSPGLIKTNE